MRVLERLRRHIRETAYKFEQWSIQRRLILAYVLIMLIPSLIVSWVLFREMSGGYIDKIREETENGLRLELVNVRSNIETMLRTAEMPLSDHEVLDYLVRKEAADTAEAMEIKDKFVPPLDRLQWNNPKIAHIRVFSDNPYIDEMYPVFWKEARIAQEPWFTAVNELDGEFYWQLSPHDNELIERGSMADRVPLPKVMLIREVIYPAGNHAGMIEVDMRLRDFFPKVYRTFEGEQAQMAVVDRSGQVYYNQDNTWYADSGVTDEMLVMLADRDDRSPFRHVRFTAAGEPMLGTIAYIEEIDARLVNVVSLTPALRELTATRNKLIAAIVGLLVILSAVTYYSNAFILKRLIILRDSMKKVRQGDFAFDIPVRGGGEVGELAHHFRKMLKKINELIAEAVQKQAASKETELRSLKNQIDSHFLYNTLENIKMMAEIDGKYEISDALTSLGGLMRYNLRWTSEYVRLADELAHIANYVAIMNIRFERKVELVDSVPKRFHGQEVLKLSLQPIVENAVKHGFRDGGNRGLKIRLDCREDGDAIVIELTDNGFGMPPEAVEALQAKLESGMPAEPEAGHDESSSPGGIGLLNVQRRIRLYYGPAYGLRVESEAGSYTRVIMRLPHTFTNGEAI